MKKAPGARLDQLTLRLIKEAFRILPNDLNYNF